MPLTVPTAADARDAGARELGALVTLYDFGDGAGPVPARRHVNPRGMLGGWVAESAHVSRHVEVRAGALVYGAARVTGFAQITGEARVFGRAVVKGRARIGGRAWVSDDAFVYGDAYIGGGAWVRGPSRIGGLVRPSTVDGRNAYVNLHGIRVRRGQEIG